MTEDQSPACLICGEADLSERFAYRVCRRCGHELRSGSTAQTFIVNEPLEVGGMDTPNLLDRFKLRQIREDRGPSQVLVDFGSAAGRFLHQCRRDFAATIGVEVTPEAVAFSRDEMGLDIRDSTEKLPDEIDLVTCWHSLEHVPPEQLRPILTSFARRLGDRGRIVVSVPNAASFQYRWLGTRYAYFDLPNHPHQFSPLSLDLIMSEAGFRRARLAFSAVYNLFGWLQGLLNLLVGGHNHLYYRMKRGSDSSGAWKDAIHLALLPFVAGPALVLTALEALRPEKQGVLTARYEKC